MNKIKDPRFSNVWMDLDLNAGVRYVLSDFLTLGASLKWRNTLEQLNRPHLNARKDPASGASQACGHCRPCRNS